MSKDKYIRASEIGTFVFCKKAWSYGRQGIRPTAKAQKSRDIGTVFHRAHGTSVVRSRTLMFIGSILLLIALAAFFTRTFGTR
jgi:hypothetical protein